MASSSSSPSSLSPLMIPMELHSLNREKLFNSLREHLTSCARPLQGSIFLQGGEEQNSTLHRSPRIVQDIVSGESMLFAPRLPANYVVWMGEIKPLPHFQEKYKVTQVFYTDEIKEVLFDQYQATGTPLLFLLHGLNTDSNKYSKPTEFQGIEKFQKDLNTLHPILTECRVIKSDLELALIQFANDISSEAHVEVMRKTKVGMKEYQLESMFLHHTYMYGGCRHCSYTCICATGDNSDILHYGHAVAPNDKGSGEKYPGNRTQSAIRRISIFDDFLRMFSINYVSLIVVEKPTPPQGPPPSGNQIQSTALADDPYMRSCAT